MNQDRLAKQVAEEFTKGVLGSLLPPNQKFPADLMHIMLLGMLLLLLLLLLQPLPLFVQLPLLFYIPGMLEPRTPFWYS